MNKFLSHFSNLWAAIKDNVIFLAEFLGIVATVFVAAYIAERIIRKRRGDKEKILSTSKIAVIGVMAAISGILMTSILMIHLTLQHISLAVLRNMKSQKN